MHVLYPLAVMSHLRPRFAYLISILGNYGREVRNFDVVVLEHKRETILLVGSYAKFTQTPAMRQHLLGTDDRLLAEASPLDTGDKLPGGP